MSITLDDTTGTSLTYAPYETGSITSCAADYSYKINYNYNYNYINNSYTKMIDTKIDTSITELAYNEWDAFANHTTGYKESTNIYHTYFSEWITPVVAPGDRMRQMIQARIAPAFHRGRARVSLSIAMDVREERARQTLRRIIGEQAYRKFFRDGFITVVPKSGLTYRIFPGHDITEVYDRGIMVERLCVVLQGNFPPTDSLIMRYLLILNDEGEFSKYAVKHRVWKTAKNKTIYDLEDQAESKTEAGLTKEWAKLKVA